MTTTGTPDAVFVRPAARVLLVDSSDRTLLFRFDVPAAAGGPARHVWITPGGGLQTGETYEEAAARELFEETGLRLPIGPCVWTRSHLFRWGERAIEQRERYYLVRAPTIEIVATYREAVELEVLTEERWWAASEIAATVAEHFAPRKLADFLLEILAGRLPATPIDVGV